MIKVIFSIGNGHCYLGDNYFDGEDNEIVVATHEIKPIFTDGGISIEPTKYVNRSIEDVTLIASCPG